MDQYFLILVSSICVGVAVAALAEPFLAFWDATSTRVVDDLLTQCRQISFDVDQVVYYLRLWGVLIVAFVVAGSLLGAPIIGVVVAAVVSVAPRQILESQIRKRKRVLKDQLVDALNLIVNAAKAGSALEQSVETAARETPAPLGIELQRVSNDYRYGVTFEDALLAAKKRIQIQEFVILATTLIVAKKNGGDSTTALEEIKTTLIENQRLERKLEADVATGRMVVNILSCVPLAFFFVSLALNPEGTKLLLTTIVGQLVVALATALTLVGRRMGQKVMNIEF